MRLRLRQVYRRIRRRTSALGQEVHLIPLMLLALLFLSLSLTGYHLLARNSGFDHTLARSLLNMGLPGLGRAQPGYHGLDLNLFLVWLTNYDLRDPLHMLESSLPVTPQVVVHMRAWEDRPFVFVQELSFAPDPVRPQTSRPDERAERGEGVTAAPKVLIYHSHTSEMYLGRALQGSQEASAHYTFRSLADPTITGVMAVGHHLASALSSLGLHAVHETRIHTLPSINNSYSNSERTVREVLSKHKDFDLVIDLHRDAGVPSPTIKINGRDVARIAIVVGTAENIPLSHPSYQQNLELAYQIKNACDALYPGLMRPVQVHKDARYNQHLHPASLIFEVGSVENTLEEALLAAELLASVLARLL